MTPASVSAGADKGIDREFLAEFFRSRAIDEFAAVPSSVIKAPAGRRPADLFPPCRTVIIFGRVMGDDLFYGSVEETAPRIADFKQDLLRISDELVRDLEERGSAAAAVSSLVVRDGNLKGSLSLKHCARDAGLGEIGDNCLLLSPKSGIRLGLGGVLTDREFPDGVVPGDPVRLCTHCGACMKACPEHALRNGSIDAFRCRNIAGAMPGSFLSLFERLMGVQALEPALTAVANRIATRQKARCSACLIACPFFKKSGGNNVPGGR